MSLPRTFSSFTAADGTHLTAFDAVFYDVFNAVGIQANRAVGVGNTADANITAVNETFSNDQFAEAVIGASDNSSGTSVYIGVAVRCGGPGSGNGYPLTSSRQGLAYLLSYSGGVSSVLASTSTQAQPGDTIRLEVSGTSITALLNGSSWSGLGTVTDSTYASGKGAIASYRGSSTDGLSSFTTGNLGGGGGAAATPSNRKSLLGVGT